MREERAEEEEEETVDEAEEISSFGCEDSTPSCCVRGDSRTPGIVSEIFLHMLTSSSSKGADVTSSEGSLNNDTGRTDAGKFIKSGDVR